MTWSKQMYILEHVVATQRYNCCCCFLMLGVHAPEGYSNHCVCVCVCVCVCPPSSGSIRCLYNTLNTAIGFTLNAKDFQLTDFSKKASFKSLTSK